MNKFFGIGNLTADPVSQTFESGHRTCRFTLALNRGKDAEGKDKGADFVSIVTWNKQADSCAKYLSKGRKVAVVGSIQTGSYEKDGRKVYTVDVRADQVEFLGPQNAGGESNYSGNPKTSTPNQSSIDDLQEIDGADDDIPF